MKTENETDVSKMEIGEQEITLSEYSPVVLSLKDGDILAISGQFTEQGRVQLIKAFNKIKPKSILMILPVGARVEGIIREE